MRIRIVAPGKFGGQEISLRCVILERNFQEGPMRGSEAVATLPCLSAPRKIPDESRKNDRRPVLPYCFGDEDSEKVSA